MEKIFEQSFKLLPEQSKTHIHVPFVLDKEYSALHLSCSYSPKTVEDITLSEQMIKQAIQDYIPEDQRDTIHWRQCLPISNLVTISLDYEKAFIGCAHRHDPQQHHVISGTEASPGFNKQQIFPGQWRAVISLHSVSVPVDYQLCIEAEVIA